MGHAGAIVRRGTGTVEGKQAALSEAGVEVLESPMYVARWAREHNLR